MRTFNLIVVMLALCPAIAEAAKVGPLPYSSLVDSPFNLTRVGIDSFVEDFSEPVNVFSRELPPYGIRFPFARLNTPGAIIDGSVGWTGDSITTWGSCTDAIPPSCLSSLEIQFDETDLGLFPQAVGFAVNSFGTNFSMLAYDVQNRLLESVVVPLAVEIPPLPDEIIVIPPPPTMFVGATDVSGIARVVLQSNGEMFELDDFQYGQLVPEPPSILFCLLGLLLISASSRFGRVVHDPSSRSDNSPAVYGGVNC